MVHCVLLLLLAVAPSTSVEGLNTYGSSSILPPAPFSGTAARPLAAVKVDPRGKVYQTQILKQQLANELGLPLRDLRVVDPSFPSQIQATFTARPKAILFCIENIKVVVQKGEALVFSPEVQSVQEFIPALQQQIATMEMAGPLGIGVAAPFELIVIEAALNIVIQSLFRRVRSLSPAVASALNGLRAESRGLDVVQTQVDELLPLKNKLDELRKRVREIRRAITEILNSDEDMAMMQLGGPQLGAQRVGFAPDPLASPPAVAVEDLSDGSLDSSPRPGLAGYPIQNPPLPGSSPVLNVEMMFENYLNEVEWISAEVEDKIDEIRNTEENVVLQLDLLRNRILKFELLLSISSFVVTCGALVTGLFGMNLLNHYETSPAVFYVVSALLVASMFTGFNAFTRYARRETLL